LISNASNALDKIRYQSLNHPEILKDEVELKIELIPNVEEETLTIKDTGIGMTKAELINNLGVSARAGTKQFMDALRGGADLSMIGQFGVGFYSAYLVSDQVEVRTKHIDDLQYVWKSSGGGSFLIRPEVEPDPKWKLKRGTAVILHLKSDQKEYIRPGRLRNLVKKYSESITYPIMLETRKPNEEEKGKEMEEEMEAEEEAAGEEQKPKVQHLNEEEQMRKGKADVSKAEWEQLNQTLPLWTKPSDQVRAEEYESFYKSMSGDWENPLSWNHFHVEGQIEYRSILFCPRRPPFNMFEVVDKKRHNLRLYVRGVFVSDDASDLCPEYLNFIKGVVDSEDLPLMINREMLQQNRILKVMRNTIVAKCLHWFEQLQEDKEKFKTFYDAFARNLKLGIHSDESHRSRLTELLRYYSTKSETEFISLKQYVERMKSNQKVIYYITGDSINSIKNSPFLEQLKSKDYEVLFLVEAIDEFCVQQIREYCGKRLVAVTREGNLEIEFNEGREEIHATNQSGT